MTHRDKLLAEWRAGRPAVPDVDPDRLVRP